MPLVKYWDSAAGAWTPIGGFTPKQPYLSKDGGEISGPLTVNGNLSVEGGLKVNYLMAADSAAALDADIALRNRSVEIGGSPMTGVADPVALDDAANAQYLTEKLNRSTQTFTLNVSKGWKNYPSGGGHGLLTAVLSSEGMVSLFGVLESTAPVSSYPMTALTVLPPALRPTQQRLFGCSGASLSVLHRVDVKTDGTVQLTSGPSSFGVGHWLSLSKVCYYLSDD